MSEEFYNIHYEPLTIKQMSSEDWERIMKPVVSSKQECIDLFRKSLKRKGINARFFK